MITSQVSGEDMPSQKGGIILRSSIILLFFLLALPTQARMYQWDSPDTGRTHLSGKPPAWYRTDTEGPRVFVFDGGQLVDDTGVAVSDERQQALRRKAIVEASKNERQARERAEKAAALEQSNPYGDTPRGEPPALAIPDTTESQPPLPVSKDGESFEDSDKTDELTSEQVAEMRALVSEWESRNRAANQGHVESLNDDDTGSGDAVPSVTREQVLEYLESRTRDSRAQDD